ncbi:MAG: hypothetical protein IKO49_04800 [Bacilli bacterium]|nr:hypothetical protein [Bacilli bacterium]
MKKLINIGIVCIILGLIFTFQDSIVHFYNVVLVKFHKQEKLIKNEYYRDYDFMFVKNTSHFLPSSKKDLYNIYYTVINSGANSFSFYCDVKYKNCIKDVEELANNRALLSDINNLVHPFNSFKNIKTEYNNYGKITINVDHTYSEEQISLINDKIKEIKQKLLVNDNLSDVEKIRIYHDYIIDNNIYDSNRSDRNIINYDSDTAYGAFFQGFAICGGYTDAMALFLEDIGIKNYKISSNTHVWNAVLLNGNWLHLDLTWDDPVASDGNNYIDHNFFLIDTVKLQQLEKTQHSFNEKIYKELVG